MINVPSRYGALHDSDPGIISINNIELITDRSLEINLQKLREAREEWPEHPNNPMILASSE